MRSKRIANLERKYIVLQYVFTNLFQLINLQQISSNTFWIQTSYCFSLSLLSSRETRVKCLFPLISSMHSLILLIVRHKEFMLLIVPQLRSLTIMHPMWYIKIFLHEFSFYLDFDRIKNFYIDHVIKKKIIFINHYLNYDNINAF